MTLAATTFTKVIRVLINEMYDEFVRMPQTDDEWKTELKGFIENYEFPCIGAWDGFHVYVGSKLKSYFSFKKRYSMSSLGLVGYNKRFLHAAVGAPGSTHDGRILRTLRLYQQIVAGKVIPDKGVDLQGSGRIPLVSVTDSAFPKHSWLIKAYTDEATDAQQRYFNKKFRSARVVTEDAYGMLKGRWRFLFKQTECRMFNLKNIIMACILLHNICIAHNDPCEPRWRLTVKNLSLINKQLSKRGEDKKSSDLNRLKISNWLWTM